MPIDEPELEERVAGIVLAFLSGVAKLRAIVAIISTQITQPSVNNLVFDMVIMHTIKTKKYHKSSSIFQVC